MVKIRLDVMEVLCLKQAYDHNILVLPMMCSCGPVQQVALAFTILSTHYTSKQHNKCMKQAL